MITGLIILRFPQYDQHATTQSSLNDTKNYALLAYSTHIEATFQPCT